jgi:hypothetical protein
MMTPSTPLLTDTEATLIGMCVDTPCDVTYRMAQTAGMLPYAYVAALMRRRLLEWADGHDSALATALGVKALAYYTELGLRPKRADDGGNDFMGDGWWF